MLSSVPVKIEHTSAASFPFHLLLFIELFDAKPRTDIRHSALKGRWITCCRGELFGGKYSSISDLLIVDICLILKVQSSSCVRLKAVGVNDRQTTRPMLHCQGMISIAF